MVREDENAVLAESKVISKKPAVYKSGDWGEM